MSQITNPIEIPHRTKEKSKQNKKKELKMKGTLESASPQHLGLNLLVEKKKDDWKLQLYILKKKKLMQHLTGWSATLSCWPTRYSKFTSFRNKL